MEKELSELKKEVVEARNLVIKSDNLLKNLHAELKVVAKRNDDNYRRTWFASGAAYLIFLGMAVAVSFFASKASVSGEKAQVEVARAEVDAQKKRVEELTAQLAQKNTETETHRVTAQQALGAYRLMSEGEGEGRLKGIDEIAKLDRTKLSALEQKALDERARLLKNELAQSAFERGKIAFRKDDMKGAATDLRRYLTLDPDGPDAVQASFFLGTAQFQLHDYQAAVTNLEKFVANGKGQKNVDYGLLLLGQSHEQLGNNARAIEVYKQGMTTFSGSEFAPQMQRRMRMLQSGAAITPPAGAPAPVAAGGAPAVIPAAAAPAKKP